MCLPVERVSLVNEERFGARADERHERLAMHPQTGSANETEQSQSSMDVLRSQRPDQAVEGAGLKAEALAAAHPFKEAQSFLESAHDESCLVPFFALCATR